MNRCQSTGFTLLELIGVMAVMAILAAVLVPNVADSIDRAYADAEQKNLQVMSESLVQYLKTNKKLPTSSTASWVVAIASQSGLSQVQIEFNQKNYRRRLLYDPRFFTNSDTNFTGLTQNQGLASAPVSPRAMIISDLSANVPNVANTTTAFNNIWEQTSSATLKESKSIKIQRINFAPYFHRVVLSNANSGQPFYSLEAGSKFSIPASSAGADGVLTRFIVSGSLLQLFVPPYPSGGLFTTTIISDDIAFRYQQLGVQWAWVKQ